MPRLHSRVPRKDLIIDIVFIALCFFGMIYAFAKGLAMVITSSIIAAVPYIICESVFSGLIPTFFKNYKAKKAVKCTKIITGVYDGLYDKNNAIEAIDLAIEKQCAYIYLEDKAFNEGRIKEKDYNTITDIRLSEIQDLVDLASGKLKQEDYTLRFFKRQEKIEKIQKSIERSLSKSKTV